MFEEIKNINKSIVNEEISLHFTKEQTSCVMVKVLNSGTRKSFLSVLLISIIMEVLAQATRKPDEMKDIGIRKEKTKFSIFVLLPCLKYP